MNAEVLEVGSTEKFAAREALRETAIVSMSGLLVAALFYLANRVFGTTQTEEGLADIVKHFTAVPLYFPVLAGWVAALAVVVDALLYEGARWVGRPKGLVNALALCLDGLGHVHAFPLLVVAVAVAWHQETRFAVGPWLLVAVMALVAALSGLSSKLLELRIDSRSWLERVAPYPYFLVWTAAFVMVAERWLA